MNHSMTASRRAARSTRLVALAGVALAGAMLWGQSALAQTLPKPTDPASGEKAAKPREPAAKPETDRMAKLAEAEKMAAEALATKEPVEAPKAADHRTAMKDVAIPEMNLWELTKQGGPIMIPIGMFSILVVALGIERTIALRRRNILPRQLVRGLKSLANQERGIDPRQAYRVCQKHPSSAAFVIRAMLLKVGRPHSEIREAVNEASQREVNRLTGPVRWLTLSASVAPMLGLLGTVQGMIQAFFITAHLPVGVNKASILASSIYVALVTTFGGLVVAIPAAILAHMFNGRVLKLFRELDEVVLVLETQLHRYQRRRREGRTEEGLKATTSERVLPLPTEENKPRQAAKGK